MWSTIALGRSWHLLALVTKQPFVEDGVLFEVFACAGGVVLHVRILEAVGLGMTRLMMTVLFSAFHVRE